MIKILALPKKGYYLIRGKVKSDIIICNAKVYIEYKNKEETYNLPVSIGGNINFLIKVKKNAKLIKVEVPLSSNSVIVKKITIKKVSFLRALYKFYRQTVPLIFPIKPLTKRLKKFVDVSFFEILIHPERSYYKVNEGRALRICADKDYNQWLKIYSQKEKQFLKKFKKRKYKKDISFLIIVLWGGIQPNPLKRTLLSINQQIYNNYRVVIAKNKDIPNILKKSTEDYILFLTAGDILKQSALLCFHNKIKKSNSPDIVYSDNDFIEQKDTYTEPQFKPDWSPEYFLEYDYIQSPVIFNRKTLSKIQLENFMSNYELILRILKKDNIKIEHIPAILLSKPKRKENYQSKLNELKQFLKDKADVEEGIIPEVFRVRFKLKDNQKVSIIIPTKDKPELIKTCINSILSKTNYDNYEIILIDNGSTNKEVLNFYKELEKYQNIKILYKDVPFNFSRLINFGVKNASGKVICLLNNDMEIITPDWLKEMVSLAVRPEIGVVGAKLLYPDKTIQHAGVVLGIWNGADHAFKGSPNDSYGYMYRLITLQNYLAVTAACMVFRKEIFDKVGGFNETFSVNFNDVDFCLKVYEKGYRIVWTPHVMLYHFESKSRGANSKIAEKEIAILRKKWKKYIDKDPFYNPNLTIYKRDFSLTGEISFHCEE